MFILRDYAQSKVHCQQSRTLVTQVGAQPVSEIPVHIDISHDWRN